MIMCDLLGQYTKLNHCFKIVLLCSQNGIWFSLGWCLGMMIFALIISLFLASLYRRQLPYDKEYKSDEL